MCVERLSNFVECVFHISNFIYPHSIYFILLLFMYRLFFSCMITHGHEDVKCTHYGMDFYLGDANHTVGSFAKLSHDLQKLLVYSSRALFDGCGTTPLYEAVLQGKEVCILSLPELSGEPIFGKSLPPTLHV